MPTIPKTVIVYHDAAGKEPFNDWLNNLRDPHTRRRILQRLFRLESGNFGDCQPVGGGVNERVSFSAPATASILVKMATPSWFCSAAAIKVANAATSGWPRLTGRSI
jgi:hypothetical protein